MKKFFSIPLILSLFLTGCASTGPSLQDALDKINTEPTSAAVTEPIATNPQDTEPPLPELVYPYTEQFTGIYSMPNMESGTAQYMQIYYLGDTYLLEFSYWEKGELVQFWPIEFWPDGQMHEELTVSGQNQMFYDLDGYLTSPVDFSLTLEDDSLILCTGEAEMVGYIRDDSAQALQQNTSTYMELLRAKYTPKENFPFTGSWTFFNGESEAHITFAEDGSFRFLIKEAYCPIQYLEGAWLWDAGTNEIVCSYRQIGLNAESEISHIRFYQDTDGYLCLTDAAETLMFMFETPYEPVSDEWISQVGTDQKCGYVQSYYDVEGIYLAGDTYEEYYCYRLPQILDYTEDAQRINQEILDKYEPIIAEELQTIENGGYRHYGQLDWFQQVRDGVLSLTVHLMPIDYEREIAAYLYDINTGRQLTNREILARFGFSESDFLEQLRQGAERNFYLENSYLTEEEMASEQFLTDLEYALSEECIHLDSTMYLEWEYIVVNIATPDYWSDDCYSTTVGIPIP